VDWQLRKQGDVLKVIPVEQPLLASWNKNIDPAQMRLQAYLRDLAGSLGPLPASVPLWLGMEVDVRESQRLLHHHDLDNYLYPVVIHLGSVRFSLVSGVKRVGGGSRMTVGVAEPSKSSDSVQGWSHFACAVVGSTAKPEWKSGLRTALAGSRPSLLPPGPAEVQLVWRCSPARNWASLWKPSVDAMGPVLGKPRPFHPNDDRITSLTLHLITDHSIGWAVDVGMWWRSASGGSLGASDIRP